MECKKDKQVQKKEKKDTIVISKRKNDEERIEPHDGDNSKLTKNQKVVHRHETKHHNPPAGIQKLATQLRNSFWNLSFFMVRNLFRDFHELTTFGFFCLAIVESSLIAMVYNKYLVFSLSMILNQKKAAYRKSA